MYSDRVTKLEKKVEELEAMYKSLEEKFLLICSVLENTSINVASDVEEPLVQTKHPPNISVSLSHKETGNEIIIPAFEKINIKNLNSASLHVFTDYGSEIVLLHGYEACVKLKDGLLKPLGFKFNNELPFGSGWTGTKILYQKLREEIRNRNLSVIIEEFLMDQISK